MITKMLNGPRQADSSFRATWMTKEFPITATRSMARYAPVKPMFSSMKCHFVSLLRLDPFISRIKLKKCVS